MSEHPEDTTPPTPPVGAAGAAPETPPPSSMAEEDAVEGRAFALARDPHTLFVYWRLAPSGVPGSDTPHQPNRFAMSDWILRLESRDPLTVQDFAVVIGSGRHYAQARPGTTYRIRLGIRDAVGDFHPVLEAGTATTPPATWRAPEDAASLAPHAFALHAVSGSGGGGPGDSPTDLAPAASGGGSLAPLAFSPPPPVAEAGGSAPTDRPTVPRHPQTDAS